MTTCNYLFRKNLFQHPMTYAELVEEVRGMDLSQQMDVLYSEDLDTAQADAVDAINKIKEKNHVEYKVNNNEALYGELDIKTQDGEISVSEFINTPQMMALNNDNAFLRYNREEHLEQEAQKRIQNNEMLADEKEAWIKKMNELYDAQSKNARVFHNILKMPPTATDLDIINRCTSTGFEGDPNVAVKAARDVRQKVWNEIGYHGETDAGRGQLITNVHLKAMMEGFDSADVQMLVGCIDYIVVRASGRIDAYMVKTSNTPFSSWDSAKKENYSMQLALLSRMLAHNGINTNNIELYIVPVIFQYDNSQQNITSITVDNPKCMNYTKNNNYSFEKYDSLAKRIVNATENPIEIKPIQMEEVDRQLKHIFPNGNLNAEGNRINAETWIDAHWNSMHPKKLDGGGWELTITKIDGSKETLTVKSRKRGSRNRELVQLIQKRIDDLDTITGTENTSKMYDRIKETYERGQNYINMQGNLGAFWNHQLSKYLNESQLKEFKETDKDGKNKVVTRRIYDWQLIDHQVLRQTNILLFKNKKTHQLDVVVLSTQAPDTKLPSRKGVQNLLGAYIEDMNDYNFVQEATVGNIESVRAMVLLNTILPEINKQDSCYLGQVKVVCPNSFVIGRQANVFEGFQLMKTWDTIIDVVNKGTNGNAKLENSLRLNGIGCVDEETVLLQEYDTLKSVNKEYSIFTDLNTYFHGKIMTDGTMIEGLEQIETLEGKVEKCEQILTKIQDLLAQHGQPSNLKIDQIIALADSIKVTGEVRVLVNLYMDVFRLLSILYGNIPITNYRISKLEELGIKPTAIRNESVRRIAEDTQRSIDTIRRKLQDTYLATAFDIFKKFYENSDYIIGKNALLGRQAGTYRNIYELDENGTNTLMFKDPYDMTNNLTKNERSMLKYILFELYKIRCDNNNVEPEFKDADDPELVKNMPTNYLWVPLQKRSAQTARGRICASVGNFVSRLHNFMADPKQSAEELADNLIGWMDDDNAGIEDVAGRMRVINPYSYTDGGSTNSEVAMENRRRWIERYGVDYFETNLENIFIDYLYANISCKEYRHLLFKVRSIELALKLRGIDENDETAVNDVIRVIDEYIKLNVFNKSIMDPTSRKIDRLIRPFRRFVTLFYVAVNPRGAVRDFTQGFMENFLQAAIKYRTNINMRDVAYGYKIVFKESLNNLHSMSMLNQFNVRYGFSAFDIATANKKLRTDERDISKLAFWTMRAPDYTNRMVLFLARMHHDGVHEAYSLDENGRLKYDWKKDKRFAIYASGDVTHEKYNEQKGLYMSLIRQFNVENPELHLAYTDDLPDAYTQDQIRTIKTLGESIYASYDKSGRPLYENFIIGRQFMVFSTWLNGIVDTYFRRRQVSRIQTRAEQEIDYATGKPLFFEDDDSGATTTRDTGKPVYRDVPIMVQGVYQTLSQFARTLYGNNMNISDAYKRVMSNEVNRANMRRAISDLAVITILSQMFKLWVTPQYKKHKQEGDPNALIQNIIYECLYKGTFSSFDSFSGLYGIINYIGSSTTPATYGLFISLAHDLLKLHSGKIGLDIFFMGSNAFMRSCQDAWQMYRKENYGYARQALKDDEYENY